MTGSVWLWEEPWRRAVKTLSALFLAVLLAIHALAGAEAAALPLSMFRDGRFAALGYIAFLCLIPMGPLMVSVSWRSAAYGNASFYALGTGLLVFVAVTPSLGLGHVFCSLVLLLTFYVYYARVLLDEVNVWVFPHVVMPGVLALATRNFGLWQQVLIAYFLLIANVHYHLLAQSLRSGPMPLELLRRPTDIGRVFDA